MDWSEGGLKTEVGEASGAECDKPADLTTMHHVVNVHQVELLAQMVDWSEAGLKTAYTD